MLKYADTSVIDLYLSIVPVHQGYGAGGQQGYVLVLRDITREKSLDEERDEFISVTSHELRTPIAIAEGNIGNAQFVAQKSGDISQISKALEEAHNQILFLSDLVNDLSMFSRAEGNRLSLTVEAIDVPSLLEELAKSYKNQAEAKGLQLLAHPGEGLEEPLFSGRLYVREILQNFITNSLKYTEKGSITVGAVGKLGGVSFTVADTGIGISHGDQKRVFDKFFRSEDYRTRKTNGTGLGLYVTAKLAKLLQADISLQSELNKGSTFIIFIPNLPMPSEDKKVQPNEAAMLASPTNQSGEH
jgi:signal transduction histidine kinase